MAIDDEPDGALGSSSVGTWFWGSIGDPNEAWSAGFDARVRRQIVSIQATGGPAFGGAPARYLLH